MLEKREDEKKSYSWSKSIEIQLFYCSSDLWGFGFVFFFFLRCLKFILGADKEVEFVANSQTGWIELIYSCWMHV